MAFELRAAWALGRRVVLVLDERAAVPRVAGVVSRVAASGAFCVIRDSDEDDGLHVPIATVLTVTRAHFHQGDWRPSAARPRIPEQLEGQLSFGV